MRTGQPKSGFAINRGHFFGENVVFCVAPSAGLVDVANYARTFDQQANNAFGADSDGVTFKGSSSFAAGILIGSGGFGTIVPQSRSITFLARVYVSTTGARQVIWGDWTVGGGAESYFLEATAGDQWRQGPPEIVGGSVTVGWHTLVGSINQSSDRSDLWVDGVSVGLYVPGGGRTSAGSNAAFMQAGAYNPISWQGSGSLFAIADMHVSDSEAKELCRNPWSVFVDPAESRNRIIRAAYVAAGGGGIVGNLIGGRLVHGGALMKGRLVA